MPIKLYNTLSRRVQTFKPIKKKHVGIYTCGPTVYNYAHIGNLRTYVFEDLLKRVLLLNGYRVKHVMNITDVGHLTSDADVGEDKMEKSAKREKKTAMEIADFYTLAFKKNLTDLNILPPTKWCKATDHIKEQIKLVKILEKKGYTYRINDGIYFDSSKLRDYGRLARLEKQNIKAGARVKMKNKKNATDFALWKFSSKGSSRQMEWDSPYGVGFPGWHLECSAMSIKFLGQPFDIHCGGIDHIPVHHVNEMAQSETAFDKPLANYWMHGEFLLIKDTKMAKSDNNFITLQTIKDNNVHPLAFRYFLLQTHYRKQLNFTMQALKSAANGLQHLYNSARTAKKALNNDDKIKREFLGLVNNDLYLPGSIALIWDKLKSGKLSQSALLDCDKVLGLDIEKNTTQVIKHIPQAIKKIVNQRNKARKEKNWQSSDALRIELESMGYKVADTANGTIATKNE
ncbi:MAG: cysteine--tRNA ligase [bacterium]